MSIDGSRLKVAVEEQERWSRRVSVTVPAALVAEEEQKAAQKLASRVNLKGFRKGRVPQSMMATRFSGALRQEALDRLINDAYRQALAAENLRPISEGKLEDIQYEPQEDLRFTITFDVQPRFELGRLGGFSIERPRARVTDEHVGEVLRNVQRQNGAWKPVEEGKAVDGDLVSVHIRKLDGDAPSEGKDYEFALGEGQAIPEVESAVKSLDTGQAGEFNVTFPEDFPDEARRGEKERVEVTLRGRKVLELPALDDALARQVGEFETLDALKVRIREDLEKDAAEQAEAVVRGHILDLLLEANPFEVPLSMVERYTDTILGEQPGIPKERMAEIKENLRPEAERSVKRLLLLERVAETQGLDATEAELDVRIQEIAERSGSTPERVYASFQKAGRLEALERELTERKVFDFLKKQSTITDAPAA
ncbi:MAG TPA: trigger factor [Longimicrobiales bacterium]|nr:trigger factor [Longimicrobiales bacterium]